MERKNSDLDFNNNYYSASYSNIGGDLQNWEKLKQLLGKCSLKDSNKFLVNMDGLENVIKNFNRLNCPIVLDPKHSTLIDIGVWAYFNKRLCVTTIKKRLRYLQFMQSHRVPVDLQNPSYSNFRRHIDFRELVEGAGPNALIHEWKAIKLALNAFNIPIWPYKPPTAPKHRKRVLPFPDTVREFFTFQYSSDEYETALYQYLFYHSFLIGWRVPSEITQFKISDVSFESNKHGSIVITETKKHSSQRTLVPEHFILNSNSHKSLKLWLDVWRPKVENYKSDDSFFLQPSGKPFRKEHLSHRLSYHGKRIWPKFQPYDTRHWCAIARLIETVIETGGFNVFTVQNWLGHEREHTTKSYLGNAEQYYNQYKKSWIHSALRTCSRCCCKWGKRLTDLKGRVKAYFKTLPYFISIKQGKAWTGPLFFLWSKSGVEFTGFFKLCFLGFKSILLNLGTNVPNYFLCRGCSSCS